MRSIVGLLLVGACTDVADEEVVALADFPITEINFAVRDDHTFRAYLRYPSPYNTCLVLAEDIVATVGDEQLAISPGDFYGRMDGYPDCHEPQVDLDHLPQTSKATFHIKDATRTITCSLDAAFVARTATLVPDGPWIGTPGQKLTVRWSSAQELTTREMSVKISDADAGVLYPGDDLLSFTVPLVPAGMHTLVMRRDSPLARPVVCNRVDTAGDRGKLDADLSEPSELTTFSVDIEII